MKQQIIQYNELRAIGKELNSSLFRELSRSEIRIAARTLGLLKKNTLVLDSEEDMDRFADFAINDYYDRDGNNSVKRYLEKNVKEMSNTEEMILSSLLVAKASLYEIVEVRGDHATIRLTDLINEGNDIEIVDRGFSASPSICEYLIYTRVINVGGLRMTSGAPMIFNKENKDVLLKKFKYMLKKVLIGSKQTKLSVVFYRLNKKYGYQQVEYV